MASVLILGAGFGGLETATRLRAASPELDITVVDRRDRFVVGAAKLWSLVGLQSVESSSRSLDALRGRGIEFVHAEITGIDATARRVETSEGAHSADFLVIALGASFLARHAQALNPPAFNLYDPDAISEMNLALEDLGRGRLSIVIMGVPYKCPPAPYEAMFLIERFLRDRGRREDVQLDVYSPQPSPIPVAGPEASARIAETLGRRGIGLHPEHKAAEVDAASRTTGFGNGTTIEFDLLFGVPQHVAPDVVIESGLTGPSGWLEPERDTLRLAPDRVFAIGDCVAIPNAVGEIPKAGVFAESQGRVVADRILGDLGSREARIFDGHGYCFLEFAGGLAAKVEGDFLAHPRPAVALQEPSEATFGEKEAFVRDRLESWL